MLLYPMRSKVNRSAPEGCEPAVFEGEGITLRGWRCRAAGRRRGTMIYLHGNGDNRRSAAGVVERFAPKGFDVVAYDSRAQGESGGAMCTYGYFEKQDLRRVLDSLDDSIDRQRIVLFGVSLGAAVALQEAAGDSRISAIVAVETFSDLRTVAQQRAPFFFSEHVIRQAFAIAEQRAGFDVDAVSPLAAAPHVTAPVLLIHGAGDRDTPPDHSQRVFDALRGPKKLVFVPGAGHNQSLRDSWDEISEWLETVLPPLPHEPPL
jgi:fermentation-respiration switch protein FrsA (DUF1100 family)